MMSDGAFCWFLVSACLANIGVCVCIVAVAVVVVVKERNDDREADRLTNGGDSDGILNLLTHGKSCLQRSPFQLMSLISVTGKKRAGGRGGSDFYFIFLTTARLYTYGIDNRSEV